MIPAQSQCLNPDCLKVNPYDSKFCQWCRSMIILKIRTEIYKPLHHEPPFQPNPR